MTGFNLGAAMSLRKSPILTSDRIEANRRNARKTAGPRTARGKAYSRLNRLKRGGSSPVYGNLLRALLEASPYAVEQTACAVLTVEEAAHPVLREAIEVAREAEMGVVQDQRGRSKRWEKRDSLFLPQTKPGSN
jgi:hypothetical protein